MRRPHAAILLARRLVVLIGLTLLAGCAGLSAGPSTYAIGLWGDLPYSEQQAREGVPRLIADMNAHRLAFSAHNGDLKAGSGSPCDDALYERSRVMFDTLDAAAMFTPGDNDWTDCDRPSNGGYNSRERMDMQRKIFFSTGYSMGRRPVRQDVQTEPLCLGARGPVACAENRRWMWHGVVYATLNVQGSCNNLCDTAPDPAEHAAREAANLRWLREAFREARSQNAAAIMLISQASPGWDESDGTRAPRRDPRTLRQTEGAPDGFGPLLAVLRDEVIAFRRPVAYVHGDSHYFRIDKPLLDSTGRRVENFTRVETFGNNAAAGNNEAHWVKAWVDPGSREVFSWQPMIVPGNRVTSPAP